MVDRSISVRQGRPGRQAWPWWVPRLQPDRGPGLRRARAAILLAAILLAAILPAAAVDAAFMLLTTHDKLGWS